MPTNTPEPGLAALAKWVEEQGGVPAVAALDRPPPGASVEGIPEALDAVVMRCIEKKPDSRFANAGELLNALRSMNQ